MATLKDQLIVEMTRRIVENEATLEYQCRQLSSTSSILSRQKELRSTLEVVESDLTPFATRIFNTTEENSGCIGRPVAVLWETLRLDILFPNDSAGLRKMAMESGGMMAPTVKSDDVRR